MRRCARCSVPWPDPRFKIAGPGSQLRASFMPPAAGMLLCFYEVMTLYFEAEREPRKVELAAISGVGLRFIARPPSLSRPLPAASHFR